MRSSVRAVLISIVLIASWQLFFYYDNSGIPKNYSIQGTVGGGGHHLEGFRSFVGGFKKTGLYPIASTGLQTEVYDTYRMGDRGKMYLLWFDSLFSEFNWSYIRTSSILFTTAILIFFLGFYQTPNKIFSIASTIFIGSSSFQLYEVYVNNNIFSLPISVTIFIMGINSFAFRDTLKKISPGILATALFTGLLLGFVKQVRTEPVIVGISVGIIYLLMKSISIKSRLLLVSLCIAGFIVSNISINYYLDSQQKKAEAYISDHGGEVYKGYKRKAHLLWHPIFCGFGDYASELGYKWDDYVAYSYALNILRINDPNLWPEFNENLKDKKLSDYFIASDAAYKSKLEDRDDYEPILKGKVIKDVTEHPWIFIQLYLKRAANAFLHTSGLQVSAFNYLNLSINFSGLGFIFFIALALALRKRDWFSVKVLFFSLPLLASSLLITSQNSYEFYSIYPGLSAAILISYAASWIANFFNRKKYHG